MTYIRSKRYRGVTYSIAKNSKGEVGPFLSKSSTLRRPIATLA